MGTSSDFKYSCPNIYAFFSFEIKKKIFLLISAVVSEYYILFCITRRIYDVRFVSAVCVVCGQMWMSVGEDLAAARAVWTQLAVTTVPVLQAMPSCQTRALVQVCRSVHLSVCVCTDLCRYACACVFVFVCVCVCVCVDILVHVCL